MTKKNCIIIGRPVSQSLSPLMHNTAYQALKIDNDFLYSAREVKIEDLEKQVQTIRNSDVVGVSVTIPHKISIIPFLDEVSQTAKEIGAVNTLYKKDGKLLGTNTDWIGVLNPLRERTDISGKKVALFGAGGAARAACYAMKTSGAQVTVINRTQENARKIAADFDCGCRASEDVRSLGEFDIIINSIPYQSESDFLPVNPTYFMAKHIVFDMVYLPYKTKLLLEAEKVGAVIIPGVEMLLYQGVEQFKIFTGINAPVEVMRDALLKSIK